MDLTLTLELQAPLLVGGRKLGPNAYTSLDHVPGSVIRAAMARALMDQCPYFDPQAPAPERYRVKYHDGDACPACPWQAWCAAFAGIQFGHAHPEGASVLPLTAFGCKTDEKHPVVDALVANIRRRAALNDEPGQPPLLSGDLAAAPPHCGEAGCGGRLERRAGYHAGEQAVRVDWSLYQRVGLDARRHTAADGFLYGLQTIREGERTSDGEWRPTRFTAPISFPDSGQPAGEPPGLPVREMAFGARTSTGMGRCRLSLALAPPDPQSPLAERVETFTDRVTRAGGGTPPAPPGTYVALTLQTDADPGLAPQDRMPSGVSNADFRQAVAQALRPAVGPDWSLTQLFAGFAFWGGWDTSKPGGARKEPRLLIQRGSVLVLYHPASPQAAPLETMEPLEEGGLGLRCADGYGRVRVCDAFHLKYALEG